MSSSSLIPWFQEIFGTFANTLPRFYGTFSEPLFLFYFRSYVPWIIEARRRRDMASITWTFVGIRQRWWNKENLDPRATWAGVGSAVWARLSMRPRGRGVLPPEVSVSPPRTGNVNERYTKRFDKSEDFFFMEEYYHIFFHLSFFAEMKRRCLPNDNFFIRFYGFEEEISLF